MIQVGIIGSGFIGPAHIEALRRLGGVNVVALCDSSLAGGPGRAGALFFSLTPRGAGTRAGDSRRPGGT